MFKELLIYIAVYVGFFAVTFYVLSVWSLKKKDKPIPLPEKELPTVSIVVPAFNESRGIQGTIRSALAIDYPAEKLDIIVVDDGSRDNTYELAAALASDRVHVYRLEQNRGKGHAMNYGISKSKGEIIVTMDADHVHVKPDALKKMMPYFNGPRVMCVSPMMAVYRPKGLWQRVQHIEYLFGVFLRKAFASVNAIHVTPGAFSAYRRSLFEKIGGFEARNITEDLEMALRIQLHNFVIENSTEATIFTPAPKPLRSLAIQRRRWNAGLLKNLWN